MTMRPCPVKNCIESIGSEHAMCPTHWEIVPPGLKQTIWRLHSQRKRRELMAAVRAAVKYVERMKDRGANASC